MALLTALAALGARMPFWDRDIDLIVVPDDDTRSLNGLLAVVDRYHLEQIVSAGIGDSRAGREWLDTIATWPPSMQPSIVITRQPIESLRGVTVVSIPFLTSKRLTYDLTYARVYLRYTAKGIHIAHVALPPGPLYSVAGSI